MRFNSTNHIFSMSIHHSQLIRKRIFNHPLKKLEIMTLPALDEIITKWEIPDTTKAIRKSSKKNTINFILAFIQSNKINFKDYNRTKIETLNGGSFWYENCTTIKEFSKTDTGSSIENYTLSYGRTKYHLVYDNTIDQWKSTIIFKTTKNVPIVVNQKHIKELYDDLRKVMILLETKMVYSTIRLFVDLLNNDIISHIKLSIL